MAVAVHHQVVLMLVVLKRLYQVAHGCVAQLLIIQSTQCTPRAHEVPGGQFFTVITAGDPFEYFLTIEVVEADQPEELMVIVHHQLQTHMGAHHGPLYRAGAVIAVHKTWLVIFKVRDYGKCWGIKAEAGAGFWPSQLIDRIDRIKMAFHKFLHRPLRSLSVNATEHFAEWLCGGCQYPAGKCGRGQTSLKDQAVGKTGGARIA